MRPFHPLPPRPQTGPPSRAPGGSESSLPALPQAPYHHHQRGGGEQQGRSWGRGRGGGGGSGGGGGRGRGRGRGGYNSQQHSSNARRSQHRGSEHSGEGAAPATTTDGPPDATIQGLNIRLDHPLLIEHWLAERKKRWPTRAVIEQKERDAVWRLPGSSAARSQTRKRKRDDDNGAAQKAQDRKGKGRERRDAHSDSGSSSDSSASSLSSEEDSSSDDTDEEDDADHGGEEVDDAVTGADKGEEEDDAVAGGARAQDEEGSNPHKRQRVDDRADQQATLSPSKIAPGSAANGTGPVHDRRQQPQPQQPQKYRPRPRGPASNPFARPSSALLQALLRREVASHTSAVLQFLRFLVLNSFLIGIERKRGDAEEALRRSRLVVEVGDSRAEKAAEQEDEATVDGLKDGPSAQSHKVTIRPLSSLAYPPAPDPLTFLDPLRALDPFPLTHEQLVAFCEDDAIRDAFAPCTLPLSSDQSAPAPTSRQRESSLTTAIRTLDALPTEAHRTAALELILHHVNDAATGGGGARSIHPHLGAIWHPPTALNSSNDRHQQKPISETELFRLGLRVGFGEQEVLRLIAERVSVLLEQVPVHAALPAELKQAVGLVDERSEAAAPAADVGTEGASVARSGKAKVAPVNMGAGIYEARGVGWQQLEWEREWERRETLKRLGLRLD